MYTLSCGGGFMVLLHPLHGGMLPLPLSRSFVDSQWKNHIRSKYLKVADHIFN